MNIAVEITPEGLLKVKNPEQLAGKEVALPLLNFPQDAKYEEDAMKQWENLKRILAKSDAMDYPRRTIEDILNDLREFRSS
jgi:hypothetical protein